MVSMNKKKLTQLTSRPALLTLLVAHVLALAALAAQWVISAATCHDGQAYLHGEPGFRSRVEASVTEGVTCVYETADNTVIRIFMPQFPTLVPMLLLIIDVVLIYVALRRIRRGEEVAD